MKNIYNYEISKRYIDLQKSGKKEFDNNDLWKIFEYFSCIKLTDEYNKQFYCYEDIDPNFKEKHNLSYDDTGIDCCNLQDTIVQCKLRKNNLTWKDCATFFSSCLDNNNDSNYIRWNNLIITRNSECSLSKNLLFKKNIFIDKPYPIKELLNYCENLLLNPPKLNLNDNEKIILRDYQIEAINIIKKNDNAVICLPTGSGKNVVIIHSLNLNNKYLILVPRIILMDQLKTEIINIFPNLKNNIQCIGDNNNAFNPNKNICICVYNSINIIKQYAHTFDKIFIDEAHHIHKPLLYCNDDDSETSDEFKSSYIDEIYNLQEYNNNIYLSATIDKIKDTTFYKKDIRDMINQKYLCDYTINIPIFSDDPTNRNICEYIIKNYRNIIFYCNSQNEGKRINELMNNILPNCSKYIDCNTTKKDRIKILNEYKNGDLPFLVNVRILIEGFNAPITKGVCFIHMPSNKTNIIQIVGRTLRKHESKKIANIILPFSSNSNFNDINNFIRIIAENDYRIKESFKNKNINGYININKNTNDDDNEDLENDIELKYTLIFDSLGVLINRCEIWKYKLNNVKKYIDENKQRPLQHSKDKDIKVMGKWLSHQITNYKKQAYIMANEEIRNKWEEFIEHPSYKEYFVSNEEQWDNYLNNVKKYIDENKRRPPEKSKDKDIKFIGSWLLTQITNYKKQAHIMKNEEIRNKWEEFIGHPLYKEYFVSNDDKWDNYLNNVIKYIDENKRRPSKHSKNKDIKVMCSWLSQQIKNYKKQACIMANEEIRNKWEEFIGHPLYKEYFVSNEEQWNNDLNNVIKYIDENKRRPSKKSKDKDVKVMGSWLSNQTTNYKKQAYIMENEDIRKKWEEFIGHSLYKEYFVSNDDKWDGNLNNVKKYIDENKQRPSDTSKNKDVKFIGSWLSTQITNYKKQACIMANEEIRNKWEEFIEHPLYKEYFVSNEEQWDNYLNNVIKYIDENKQKPSNTSKNKDVKFMGTWLSTQIKNYKKQAQIMANEEIRKKWEEFIGHPLYKEYFVSNEEQWINNLNEVKKYIDENKQRPSSFSKDKDIKVIGSWLSHQITNYKKQANIMANEEIRNKWEEFIGHPLYKEYFK